MGLKVLKTKNNFFRFYFIFFLFEISGPIKRKFFIGPLLENSFYFICEKAKFSLTSVLDFGLLLGFLFRCRLLLWPSPAAGTGATGSRSRSAWPLLVVLRCLLLPVSPIRKCPRSAVASAPPIAPAPVAVRPLARVRLGVLAAVRVLAVVALRTRHV